MNSPLVMPIVEGQFQCVLTGRFHFDQLNVELAELQDGFAVALDLGGRRVRAQQFGWKLVYLVGPVGEAEGV